MRDSPTSSSALQSPRQISATGGTVNGAGGSGLEYLVEPFAMTPNTMPSFPSDPSVPLLPGGNPTSPTSRVDAQSASGLSDQAEASRRTNVYVVHHDGGRAPVSVYTEEGADVVELPPRYPASSTSGPSESEASRETNRRRHPGATPRKSQGPRST